MATPDEIAKKLEELMNKAVNDPDNAQQHLDNLMSYLEGLGDLVTHPLDQTTILTLMVFFRVVKSMIKMKKEYEKNFSGITSDLNNALSRIKRLEDEFAEMKKGK